MNKAITIKADGEMLLDEEVLEGEILRSLGMQIEEQQSPGMEGQQVQGSEGRLTRLFFCKIDIRGDGFNCLDRGWPFYILYWRAYEGRVWIKGVLRKWTTVPSEGYFFGFYGYWSESPPYPFEIHGFALMSNVWV